MGRWAICLGVIGLASRAASGWGQTGYQYEELAPDPVLKTPATLESMAMRAGYEQKHRDCLDSRYHLDAVVAARPDWAGVLELRLFCEREENRRVDEWDDLNRLVELQPTNWKRWLDRANLEERNLERQDALRDVTRAIELRGWEVNLYEYRYKWREEEKDYAGALSDLEEIHRLYPEFSLPLKEMARVAVLTGKDAAVVARYSKLAEIGDPKPEDSPRFDDDLPTEAMSSEELMLRAGYALRLHKQELELRFLNSALVRQPGLMPALERRIQIARGATPEQRYLRIYQVLDPRKDVDTLISLDPNRPDFYRLRIEIRQLRPTSRREDEAMLKDYGMLIKLDPFVGRNYADRADFTMRMKDPDFEAAIADYRRAIDLEPGNAQYCYRMAKAYEMKKASLTQALALNWALIGEPENAAWQRERAKLP